MKRRLLVSCVLCIAVPASGFAQGVEILFSRAVVPQAVALKSALHVDNIESFNALSLAGASAERKSAFASRVSRLTAVVIVGDDALRAVADVQFTVPVVLVNASGRTAAKNRVLRVFDGSSGTPAGATAVAPAAVGALVAAARDLVVAGDVPGIVQALLTALK